jgi:hypothetical protein
VQAGEPVLLDGRASIGGRTYDWTTDNGTVVPDTIPGLATWTPETPSAAATVTLTVTGRGGTSVPARQDVQVIPAGLSTVQAGADQVKTRGAVVTLSGAGSGPVRWTQLSGPAVTLSSTTSLTPSFTYPKMARPVGPAGNSNNGYVVHNEPVVLQLAAVGGGFADEVTISPTPETITPGTARYRTKTGVWRVTGTTDLKAGQTIAMVLGPNASGKFIGQATVDAAGAFSFKGGAQPVAAGATVTYVSAMGGSVTGQLQITR